MNKELEEINKIYNQLQKRVFICKDCMSHILVNKNESVNTCNRCGSKDIIETPVKRLPYTLSQLKKMDTLEITDDNFNAYKDIVTSEIKKPDAGGLGELFMYKGVVKHVGETTINYIYFYSYPDDSIELSIYMYSKRTSAFYYGMHVSLSLEEEDCIKEINVNPIFLENKEKELGSYDIKDNAQYLSRIFFISQMIFKYLSIHRNVEEIKSEIIPNVSISQLTRNGNKKVKKKRVIYMTDTIKIYTYDENMAGKIKQHKPISVPYWKVRGFTRRVFDKADRHLPKDERRVLKVSNVAPFLKGRERLQHSVDDISLIYKIAR